MNSHTRRPILLLLWVLLLAVYVIPLVTFWRGNWVVGGDFGSKGAAIIAIVVVIALLLAPPVVLARVTVQWLRHRAA